ncbi:MAG TPA: acylneuraminate cytidylyltransferase family protein [Flavobacteriales bacterium]|nr:acylneuraminate cytidylyltransferase family protein [Flavobacteriales bacterium]
MDNLVEHRVAVIPARGGSKRLPKKNIMEFYGKPMIAWTIEAALDSKLFDLVLVSTDCEEIASVSRASGATVPFLRINHADDFSTVSEATIGALEQLKNYNGKSYETVVQLMANCPLRSSNSIHEQIMAFEGDENGYSLLSGFKYGMFNPWWAHEKKGDGRFQKVLNYTNTNTRSQDLPELICPSGATWISRYHSLIDNGTFYSEDYRFHQLSWLEAVDIDDENDLGLAKAAFLLTNENI